MQRDATTIWRRLEAEKDAGTSHRQPSASHALTHRQASTELLESLALAEAVAAVLRGLQVVAEDTNRPSSMLPTRLRVPQLRRLQHLRRICPEWTRCEDMDEAVRVLCDYTLVEVDATL
jgi:hypothetical protein